MQFVSALFDEGADILVHWYKKWDDSPEKNDMPVKYMNAGQAGRVDRCFALAPYSLHAETCEMTSPASLYNCVVSSITNHNGHPFFPHGNFVSFPDHSPGSLDTKPIYPQH